MYYFHTQAYNASKHGHRVVHTFNFNKTNANIPVLFFDRKTKNNESLHLNEPEDEYHIDWISTDGQIINDQIIPAIENFSKIYDILIHNNKALSEKRNSDFIFYD